MLERTFFRTIILILLSLVAIPSHASEEIVAEGNGNIVVSYHKNQSLKAGTGSFLFITTVPFGARVLVDDVQVEGRTPLVIMEPQVGEQNLRIEMSGFESLEIAAEIGIDEAIVVEGTLNPTGTSLFVQDGMFNGAGGKVFPPGGYSFDPGYYDLGNSDGLGTLTPVYPNQKWIDALNIAIPIVSVFAGGLVIAEAVNPRTEGNISPFTIGVLVTDLLLIGADIGLHVHRSRWRNEWEVDSAAATPPWAEDDYRLAEEALAAGHWEKARDLFDRYTLIYPLDEQSPKALYRSARLSFLRGDVTACIRRLDRMKTEYPVPEYWDRIWRLSADAAFSKGRLDEGLEALDMILGLDDLVGLESAALKKALVLTEEFEQNGESEPALEAWSELIETWPDSDSVEEYRNQRDSIGREPSE